MRRGKQGAFAGIFSKASEKTRKTVEKTNRIKQRGAPCRCSLLLNNRTQLNPKIDTIGERQNHKNPAQSSLFCLCKHFVAYPP
jgi:hypothetical protein